jgi:senataxin
LKATYDFLLQTPPGASDDLLHWFCPRADSLVREAATFLLRLFAYDSSRVIKWKAELSRCLRGCPGCAKALQDVKLSSRLTCV